MTNYLEVDDLVEIASIVLGEAPQVRDFGLLSSAVARPVAVAFGQEAYTDLWSKAAALLHSVCMNHALIGIREDSVADAGRHCLEPCGW